MNSLDTLVCDGIENEQDHGFVEARRERLQWLKTAIEEGRYVVSSDLLAEKLMQHMMRK